MKNKPSFAWMLGSFVVLAGTIIWRRVDEASTLSTDLCIISWMSSLLAIGNRSTPSGSVYGKVAFSFVVLMVAGILMKIGHLFFATEFILGGLLGLGGTYAVMWFRSRPRVGEQ